ncbi:acyl-CoA N-acyltransferase [Apiospora kogelbergensis]|uniref:acyl-CoA N-acyltransferase n=1 Tax=Apiospora kogelbergensis TaxID=1337665 RepID=UPI003132836D
MSGGVPLGDRIASHAAGEPQRVTLDGTYAKLVPLQESHSPDLYKYLCDGSQTSTFVYMSTGPWEDEEEFTQQISMIAPSDDPFYFTVITKQALGSGAGAVPAGVEIGWVTFSPRLQRTTAATEAFHLLMRYCMDDLGNRRLEWKCDTLNAKSRRAAERLGFAYEGTFRKHRIVRGRNRDTDWFSIVDDEWDARNRALLAWLAPENFDEGRQVRSLDTIRDEMKE